MHKKISIEQSKISDGINFVENGLAELKIAKKQSLHCHALPLKNEEVEDLSCVP